MSIFTEYSLWFVPLCIIIGLGIASVLYYRNSQSSIYPTHIIRIAFVLRTIIVSVLLFLLLAPYVQRTKRDVIKPVVVIVQDNSKSIKMHKDSLYYTGEYLTNLYELRNSLSDAYTTEVFTFGERISQTDSIQYTDTRTNISDALQQIHARYYTTNLGAIILASDGLYNTGDNPLYSQAAQTTVPIYTIALGNSNQVRDNVVRDVQHNAIVFKQNPFGIRIFIESHNLQGKQSIVRVYEGKKQVYETRILPKTDNLYTSIDCKLSTTSLGQVLYTVTIEEQHDEITFKNNTFLFTVDVLESRQNILLIYDAVHPDVGAIRRAIESNKNFSVSVYSSKEFKGDVRDYNCLIFHGLPQSFGVSKELTLAAKKYAIPSMYIYNSTMNTSLLDILNVGVVIQKRSGTADEVQARYEPSHTLFEIEPEIIECIETAPPVFAAYGEYSLGAQSNVMLWQQMQQVQLSRPLLVFSEKDGYKTAFFAGEGLWRWRMHAFKKYGSFSPFDVFINKCVNYLALTQKRELFHVQTAAIITENQDVVFRAELYNKSFEPIENKEIALQIFDAQGKEYPYVMSATQNYYSLQIGKLPVGKYTYKAYVTVDNTKLEQKGSFMVMPLHMEYTQTRANHALLQALSQQSGGSMVAKEHISQLYDSISRNSSVTPISYTSTHRTLLLDSVWILMCLLALISTEWFLRKFYGGY